MKYAQALKYLSETCWFGKNPTLRNIRKIMQQIGHPHKRVPVIQITGTNGKSSVAWAVSEILTRQGLRTATYTSPHLNSYTERFLIDGEPIAKTDFCDCLEQVIEAIGQIHKAEASLASNLKVENAEAPIACSARSSGDGNPLQALTEFTHFEILTAMAYLYFAEQKVDVAVFEVGMGGRWDATSICVPIVSVITNIELDHTERLGKTKKAIARDKAFIIKKGSTAIIGDISGEALDQILKRVEQVRARCLMLGKEIVLSQSRSGVAMRTGLYGEAVNANIAEKTTKRAEAKIRLSNSLTQSSTHKFIKKQNIFSYRSYDLKINDLYCDLLGDHQKKNMALAIGAAEAFLRFRKMAMEEQGLRVALANAASPGRMDVIDDTGPIVMLDGAHNEAGVLNLLKEISKYINFDKLIIVAAILEDKNIKAMAGALAEGAGALILTKNYSYRSADPRDIAAELPIPVQITTGKGVIKNAGKNMPKVNVEPDLKKAIEKSREVAGLKDLILITGSLYTVGHARYVMGLGPLDN